MKLTGYFLNKKYYRYFALGWAALIFIISTIPNLPQPDFSEDEGPGLRLDYLFHFMAYFILGMLIVIWQIRDDARLPTKTYVIIVVLGVLFGLIDEWHQVMIPGRTFNPMDFYLNAIGFLVAFFFVYHYLIRHLMVHGGKFPELHQRWFNKLKSQPPFSPEK